MSSFKRRVMWLLFIVIVVLMISIIAYSRVDNRITKEDIVYIKKFISEGKVESLGPTHDFDQEVTYIRALQKAVQDRVVKGECLPLRTSREPKDVYLARCGESYDRSRVIEKALRHAGFQTRHSMIFSTVYTKSKVKVLLSPGGESHSLTEVLTQNGWLVIDPDFPWLSLDKRGEPVTLAAIQSDTSTRLIAWYEHYSDTIPPIYREPFVFIYGLYSRHGKFYSPYNFIPDINWPEFIYNMMQKTQHRSS